MVLATPRGCVHTPGRFGFKRKRPTAPRFTVTTVPRSLGCSAQSVHYSVMFEASEGIMDRV